MLDALRLGWKFARIGLHLCSATLIIASYFPFASPERRAALISWWSRGVLRICGMRLQASGQLERGQGVMLVLNHISWIDIYVVHALSATRFVAKSEIRGWPLIGYLCEKTGTIFIERGRRHAVHQANHIVAEALAAGSRVGVFPEGTTTDGSQLLPFHANLIQAAINAGVPVQPVAIRYRTLDGALARHVAYIGDTSLLQSMVMILRGPPVLAELTVLPALPSGGASRHGIAKLARESIALSLALDIADRPPASELDYQGELL